MRTGWRGSERFQKLQPVPERVVNVGLSPSLERRGVDCLASGGARPGEEGVEVGHHQSHVRLAGGTEVILHAEVKFNAISFEPASASPGEVLRLGDFGKTEHACVEDARIILRPRGKAS